MILQGIGDISRPAHLFASSGEQEHHNKEWDGRPGNEWLGERSPQEQHDSVREQQEKRVQEDDEHIPDWVPDTFRIENPLEELAYAITFLFSVHQDERCCDRTHDLQRTERQIDWRQRFQQSTKQPEWQSKSK